MNKFKVGDWCFSNFELCQIKEIKDGLIKSVTNGFIERSGSDLSYSCFPLDIKIKRISDSVEHWHKKLHAVNGINLNYPDIVRSLESRWIEMCENKDDSKVIETMYDSLAKFCNAVIEKAESLRYEQVEGISLIRP